MLLLVLLLLAFLIIFKEPLFKETPSEIQAKPEVSNPNVHGCNNGG